MHGQADLAVSLDASCAEVLLGMEGTCGEGVVEAERVADRQNLLPNSERS